MFIVIVASGCAWSEPLSKSETNSVPEEIPSTNEGFSEISCTNDVLQVATNAVVPVENVFPVQVDEYVSATPVSAGLNSLFQALDSMEAGTVGLSRGILIESLSEGQGRAGVCALRKYLRRRARRLTPNDFNMLDEMVFITCCARSLEVFQDTDVPTEVWAWLFGSDERIRLVAETVSDDDNTFESARIIQRLYEHDPESRDQFLNLILAFAVVWDTPRTEMHQQIGDGWQPPDENVTLYYDYFKKLYSSADAMVAYDELNVDSLVFVVDIPAPVSELEWALENVDGTRSRWGDHYDEITYDLTRLIKKRYVWPHHEYTLQEIQECFGICVDQAYYSVITARAHGIPCLYFHGVGQFAGHAWFGFMRENTEWDLEVGRYSKQGYATGFAIQPQTDREMTDHELEHFCSRALHPEKFRVASMLVHLAALLQSEDLPSGALIALRQARQVDPMCDVAWEMECDVLENTGHLGEAITLLDEKTDCFDFFPDVAANALLRKAVLLRQSGDTEAAEKLLRMEVARVASRRDDLQQRFVLAQANQLLAQGNAREGMEVIESILQEQCENGSGLKVYTLIAEYKKFAERAGLSPAADRFLKIHNRMIPRGL